MMKGLVKLTTAILLLASLQGCVSGVVLGTIGAVSILNDRRSAATQLEDETIEIKITKIFAEDQGISQHTHINTISYNRTVLLIGQAPNQMLRDRAAKLVNNVDSINRVHNQIRIGNVTKMTTRSNDSWLTSKIKVALAAEKNLASSQVKVMTESGEVFLMGLVSKEEGNIASEVARNVNGVRQVIKVFEYQ